MNGSWSFYDPATGRLVGRTFSGPASMLAANTPAGLAAIAGEHNHITHRVTLATGEVEQWRDPRPSDDHEWDSEAGAWRRSAAADRRDALARIVGLEAQQLRPLRELAVDPDNPIARERLTSLDAQIAALRELL